MIGSGIIVSLCDLTGNMVRPWAEAGYECYAVDIQHSIRRDRTESVGRGVINYVWGDVRSWTPNQRVVMGFAFTPCTNLAVSGARDFQKKAWPMLRDGLDMFHAAVTFFGWAGCPWMAENPVGRIAGIMGKSEHTFDPCDYAGYPGGEKDDYTKKTCLWTGGASSCRHPSGSSPHRAAVCTCSRRLMTGLTFVPQHPWALPGRYLKPITI